MEDNKEPHDPDCAICEHKMERKVEKTADGYFIAVDPAKEEEVTQ